MADWGSSAPSVRVADDRDLPESEKGSAIMATLDAFAREYRPYTSGVTYPVPHGRTMPLARDAGINSVPYASRVDPNSDLYLNQRNEIDPLSRHIEGWGGALRFGSLAPAAVPSAAPAIVDDGPAQAQAAAEAAALRQRVAVRNPNGQPEGAITRGLDHLGVDIYNTLAKPARVWGALGKVPMGQPLSERPDIVDAVAQIGTDLLGAPALMPGGVVKGAVTMGAARRPFTGPPEEGLMAVHNTRADRLAKADEIGGLAVPSVAIVKPEHGFGAFGDISMVAKPEFVQPARGNPVFASDVYSPRFPSLNDEGTKIFRGFTDMGNRRYAPLTLDNLVREMKGNVRGGEGGLGMYGAGAVRSAVSPQFGSLSDIQAARGKIVPKAEFETLKSQTNDELLSLAEQFQPYYKYGGRGFDHINDFSSMLGEYSRGGLRQMHDHYKDLPPELLDKARGFLGKLREMPTEYFEAKPQRAVRLGEFEGAVVPDREMAAVAPILDRHGIKRIEQYPAGDMGDARRDALKKFPDLLFSNATDKKTGALIAGAEAARPFGSLSPTDGIRAYHVSPHDFDRFDFSKIGTGQGAQSYGHGGYFAENPKVSGGPGSEYWNEFATRFKDDPVQGRAIDRLKQTGFDRTKAAAGIDEELAWYDWNAKNSLNPQAASKNEKLHSDLVQARDLLLSDKPVGPRTYEVNINAKPEQFLDWHKPMDQQSEVVRNAFAENLTARKWPSAKVDDVLSNSTVGQQALNYLMPSGSKAQASDVLNKSGVPGIKYLDQGSRGIPQTWTLRHPQGGLSDYPTEQAAMAALAKNPELTLIPPKPQSSNYVLFDDKIVDILRKYAIPGAAGGAAFGSLAPGSEQ